MSNYTPHGYLQNRYDAGPFWGLDAGGPLRSISPSGFQWLGRGGLMLGLRVGDWPLLTPHHLRTAGIQVTSPYHSCHVQSFEWAGEGVRATFTFFLAARDVIGCRAQVQRGALPVTVVSVAVVPRAERSWDATLAWRPEDAAACAYADPGPWYAVAAAPTVAACAFATNREGIDALCRDEGVHVPRLAAVGRSVGATMLYAAAHTPVPPTEEVWVALARGATVADAATLANSSLSKLPGALHALLEEDDRFWAHAPVLTGDWPDEWKHSWVYDLETTRMLLYPPSGVFSGPWPTWMASHPRVVLAEGTLDMLRHSYADPQGAKAGIATLLESAPEPQVPCMWANGGYNMVASDGSACGTSPAWCLPFHNILQVFQRDPDRDWLSRIYPRMEAYLNWWLANRTDHDGWAVYKCTWESGEDCSPRLDPEQTGFADLSRMARPAELQAAIAQSARVLQLLGAHLGISDARMAGWARVYDDYCQKTRQLWDPGRGHFRDLLPQSGAWVEAAAEYWGANVTHDALQLIPLMYDVATEAQKARLAHHLPAFNAVPWVLWPSWTYVVTEACLAVGRYDVASEMSAGIIRRVYRENDRRGVSDDVAPLPGVAREYWPLTLDGWNASEAYGWGATTSLLLLRHLIGFREGPDPAAAAFSLRPMLPSDLVAEGRTLAIEGIGLRGCRFDILLQRANHGDWRVLLRSLDGRVLKVAGAARGVRLSEVGAAFGVPRGEEALVEVS